MTEVYSITTDFAGVSPNPGQLIIEIQNTVAITTTLNGITINGDNVELLFESALPGPEKTALDTVINNHVPVFIYYDERMSLSFFQGSNGYFQTNIFGSWTNVNSIFYEGTEYVKPIRRVIAVVSRDSTAEGSLRIILAGTLTVVATLNWDSGTTSSPIKVETTSIANLPTSGTILSIQIQRTSGLLSNVHLHSMVIIQK